MKSVAEVLESVKDGKLSVQRAEALLRLNAIAIVGDFARLDYKRFRRRGVPEIIYSESKTNEQLVAIVRRLASRGFDDGLPIILSKVKSEQARYLMTFVKRDLQKIGYSVRHYSGAGIVAIVRGNKRKKKSVGKVALLAAGTSDMSALNEAEVTLDLLNVKTIRFNDVGVAAIHRLSEPLLEISRFGPDAIIVAAGMEGALPSVIAGLSDVPIIGLPTSIGYGFGRGGEAALMSMLQACPLGLCVVNIDAGVAAAVVALLISRRAHSSE
jgi:pyridinium-3,5-biscarboxylic acid mononucleotide synthase